MRKIIIIIVMALGLAQNSRAATGNLYWNPTANGNWDTATANWLNTNTSTQVTFANGNDVVFDNTGAAAQPSVLLFGTLTPGAVVVDASADYTFAGTGKLGDVSLLTKRGQGKLILATTNTITAPTLIEAGTLEIGTPGSRGALGTGNITNYGTLSFNRSGTLNFSNHITGSGTLTIPVTGTGTWNIRGTNTLSNYSIVLDGAILYFTNSWSLGNPASIQINVSSVNERLQLGGGVDLPASCPITFTVPQGDVNTRASLMSMAGINSINGPIRIGGGGYLDPNSKPNINLYSQGNSVEVTVNSSVEDIPDNPFQGNFYLRGNATAGIGKMYGTISLPQATLCKDEASTWTIYSTGNRANLNFINGGRLNLAAADALPDAQLTLNATLDLGGFDQKVGPLWSLGANANGIVMNSSTTDALLTLGDGGVYYGTITDSGGAGKIGLRLLNPGMPNAQQFYGVCTYSGPTILQPATAIALMDAGSIPNTTPIEMANGSSIDVRNKADFTFTLGAAQTLKADGMVNIAGFFVSQGTIELKVSKAGDAVSTDQLAVTGQLTYGGKLKLVLSGQALSATDTLPLFSASSYGTSDFAQIEPAEPAPGLAWDTSTLKVDGILRIAGTAAPTIGTTVLSPSGTEIIFSGGGGPANGTFSVLAATNLTAPVFWAEVQTGSFDGSGNFVVTNAISPGEPRKFFKLQVP